MRSDPTSEVNMIKRDHRMQNYAIFGKAERDKNVVLK